MNTKDRLYIAYGSNLNLEQMKRRCPTAEVVGAVELKNWRLWFRRGNHGAVATIEWSGGSRCRYSSGGFSCETNWRLTATNGGRTSTGRKRCA